VVRALIAHTNRGGEKRLRKLEMSFLASGVTVCRTADDLTRHHGKMMIVDGELYVFGFNYTELDINRSRSFGISTKDPSLVKAALELFQADSTRQPYDAAHDRLVISPETTRKLLSDFTGREKELLIYDEKVSDKAMVKLLREARPRGRGEDHRQDRPAVPGITIKPTGCGCTCAIVRDRKSVRRQPELRRPQIDGRREIGIIAPLQGGLAIAQVFEQDWAEARPSSRQGEKAPPGGACLAEPEPRGEPHRHPTLSRETGQAFFAGQR
jgi:hypothetical protein